MFMPVNNSVSAVKLHISEYYWTTLTLYLDSKYKEVLHSTFILIIQI